MSVLRQAQDDTVAAQDDTVAAQDDTAAAQDDTVAAQSGTVTARDDMLSEINVTPFTDVLLVLLIIFMILASLAIPPGFERSLPCGCNIRAPKRPPPQVSITVTHAGAILVEGKAVSIAALYPLLAKMHSRAPRDIVSLDADAKAPYGVVIRVIDAAKAGGIGDVSFFTQ